MRRLDDLIRKLKAFEVALLETIEDAVRRNERLIVELNSEEQLFKKGINAAGVRLDSYRPYAESTKKRKRKKGQPTNRVTLRDERDFHYSFEIKYLSDGFELIATDFKTEILKKKYQENILGLTDENVHKFAREHILPDIIELFKDL